MDMDSLVRRRDSPKRLVVVDLAVVVLEVSPPSDDSSFSPRPMLVLDTTAVLAPLSSPKKMASYPTTIESNNQLIQMAHSV